MILEWRLSLWEEGLCWGGEITSGSFIHIGWKTSWQAKLAWKDLVMKARLGAQVFFSFFFSYFAFYGFVKRKSDTRGGETQMILSGLIREWILGGKGKSKKRRKEGRRRREGRKGKKRKNLAIQPTRQ